ncbi:hypothetical protein HPB52_017782 [Rhipicephalus sanguineus]|uniref:Uncharacterized protein n=1 Tax=Rhipicephalus sanguineus TaxID=34632 RepID=A0A9D4Q7U8_RHISA|nr:hypothetical protein HPB52_017782 [Rhipicephalus sanguineus]
MITKDGPGPLVRIDGKFTAKKYCEIFTTVAVANLQRATTASYAANLQFLKRGTAAPCILPLAISACLVSAPFASNVASAATSPDFVPSDVACQPHQLSDHALSIGATITLVTEPTGLPALIAGRPIG